jgi:hypothetical protein
MLPLSLNPKMGDRNSAKLHGVIYIYEALTCIPFSLISGVIFAICRKMIPFNTEISKTIYGSIPFVNVKFNAGERR